MSLFAYHPRPTDDVHLVLAAGLGAAGCFLLLPRPRGRSVAGGIAALLIAAGIAGLWVHHVFGEPAGDWVGKALFIVFSAAAVGFGIVLVVQRNPARGAIAFAFVILSTCGLFLLLAAPFLMAATIIIYAGAIVVTFLFVLMLSAAGGHSDENDRSREPLLGAFAGFAFTGLILFTLNQAHDSVTPASSDSQESYRLAPLPTPLVTPNEQQSLRAAAEELKQLEDDAFYAVPAQITREERTIRTNRIERLLEDVVGLNSAKYEGRTQYGSIHARLSGHRMDRQADDVMKQVEAVRRDGVRTMKTVDDAIDEPTRVKAETAESAVRKLREQVLLLAGAGELSARNTANLGYLLYSEHLLDIELAGTLLLVATIGAIAIAHRRDNRKAVAA
jgi:NADH-quinone oxidoreductase subunit J